jgi:hypothetical protein
MALHSQFTDNECGNSILFLYNPYFLSLAKARRCIANGKIPERTGSIRLSRETWSMQMQKLIMPLTREYVVEFDKTLDQGN